MRVERSVRAIIQCARGVAPTADQCSAVGGAGEQCLGVLGIDDGDDAQWVIVPVAVAVVLQYGTTATTNGSTRVMVLVVRYRTEQQ